MEDTYTEGFNTGFSYRDAEIASLKALSVTNILIDIVPGDGSGQEVYAKSVADVVGLISRLSEKAEDSDSLKAQLAACKKDAETSKLSHIDRECLRIGREIQRAAGLLPVCYEINIQIEKDAGWVTLCDSNGDEQCFSDTSDGISWCISKAIDAAMKEEA